MKCIKLFLAGLFLFSACIQILNAQVKVKRDTVLMGSAFSFTAYAPTAKIAERSINLGIREVTRIENLISDWLPSTEVSAVNANAGRSPVVVSSEVFALFQRAKQYSQISDGLFDITFAGMDKIWRFDGSMRKMPTPEMVSIARRSVGFQSLILNAERQSVFLEKTGAKVSFGSIGKAYAAEKAAAVMKGAGATAGLVDASGDIFVVGLPPHKRYWTIGLQNPFRHGRVMKKIHLKKGAVVTSGDYEKFFILDGIRYGHIINPKTGYPASGVVSVTVQGAEAEVANFLSTTLMLADTETAKQLAKAYPRYKIWHILTTGNTEKWN